MCVLTNKEKEIARKEESSSSSVKEIRTSRPDALLKNQSIFSRLTYSWPNPLLSVGKQKVLEEIDLPDLCEEDTSAFNLSLMERLSNGYGKSKKGNLHKAIVLDFIKSVWFIQPQYALESAAKIVQAIALGKLIDTFRNQDGDEVNSEEGFIWAAVLVCCGMVLLVTHHQIFFFGWRRGMQYRVAGKFRGHSKNNFET